jgi:hypothetical protein
MGSEDQIKVATALSKLVDRVLKERGVSKVRMLGDLARHLSQCSIPQELWDNEIGERRLNQSPSRYGEIAKKVAEFEDRDKDDALYEVFEKADFWRGDGSEPAQEYVQLARDLNLVANALSGKYQLSEFFRAVEKAGVSPVATPDCVRNDEKKRLFGEQVAFAFSLPGDNDGFYTTGEYLRWPIELDQLTWPSYAEHCGDLLAHPAVVLGAWAIGSPFTIEVTRPNKKNLKREEAATPAVVLRFCIVPTGTDLEATPVLRADLWAFTSLTFPASCLRLRPDEFTAGNNKIIIPRVPKLSSPFRPGDIERHASSVHDTFLGGGRPTVLFLRISPRVCQDWFTFPPTEHLDYPYLGWPLCDRGARRSLLRMH